MAKRIPVYKKCDICVGTGEIVQPQQFYAEGSFSSPPYKDIKICGTCKGEGKIKTEMFIEDPYNLFEIEDGD